MNKSKSGLVGRYEMVTLEYEVGPSQDKRMFLVTGTVEQMCAFYEAVQDALENAVNASTKEYGFQDSEGKNIGYEPDDLMDWRIYPREIAAYESAKADAKRDGYMRFAASESRFTYEGDPWSWVAALENAIKSTGIHVEPEALVV